MNGTLLVLRAIGVEFAWRIYTPILIVCAAIAIVTIGISVWLTTVSPWWWILAAAVFIGVIIAGIILTIVGVVLNIANPSQTVTQKKAVKKFVDTLQNLSEITQTPKVVLLFRVVKDIVSKSENGFVKETISHTLALRREFDQLRNSFV